ncbi:MAG: DUF4349 domain-containing protein, partial [Acidimicrobiales bacterium]
EAMEDAEAAAEDDSAGSDLAAPQAPAVDTEADTDADSPLGAGGTRVTPTAADLGRKLIFTAFVNVEVDDVAAASAEATSIIEGMGGFLFGQNTTGGTQASSELIFKVLPDDFNRALEQLGSVGELRNQSVTTDDVTERIVDLESRIEVADLGVARLRAALEGAATLEDYAEIERLLLDRESNREVMRGQLRTLQDRVDLATITLLLTQDRVENSIELRISSYEGHDDGVSCSDEQQSSVEAGTDVTVCFDIVNVGDQTLTDITLTDTVLEIDAETELIEVFGSLDELAPGQAVLVAHQINPERSLRMRTRVVAIPTDGVSSEQAGPSVSTRVDYDIRTFEPDRDPGFGDGFSAALDILKGLWVALTVTIGFLILPLLILVPLAWLAIRAHREYRGRRPVESGPAGYQPPGAPPPPPSNPAPPTAASVPGSSPDAGPAGAAGQTRSATMTEPPPEPDQSDPPESADS